MPSRRRLLLYSVIFSILLGTGIGGLQIVVGAGDSMEPRFQTCDVVVIDTTRDEVHDVNANHIIAYRSNSVLLIHDVVAVNHEAGYIFARGANSAVRERVTSQMLVGVVITDLDTSTLCTSRE